MGGPFDSLRRTDPDVVEEILVELRAPAGIATGMALVTVLAGCGIAAGNVPASRTSAPFETTSPSPTTTTTTTEAAVAIPADLTGKSVQDVLTELHGLGFWNTQVYGPDGSPVVLDDGWHVVSVDDLGSDPHATAKVTIRAANDVPTTVAPPPPPPRTVEQAPPPVYTPDPPAVPAPPAASEVYYKNCAAARAAGAAPLYRGQPGYRPALDRDNDGIACE
jgi:hypothetical protein